MDVDAAGRRNAARTSRPRTRMKPASTTRSGAAVDRRDEAASKARAIGEGAMVDDPVDTPPRRAIASPRRVGAVADHVATLPRTRRRARGEQRLPGWSRGPKSRTATRLMARRRIPVPGLRRRPSPARRRRAARSCRSPRRSPRRRAASARARRRGPARRPRTMPMPQLKVRSISSSRDVAVPAAASRTPAARGQRWRSSARRRRRAARAARCSVRPPPVMCAMPLTRRSPRCSASSGLT